MESGQVDRGDGAALAWWSSGPGRPLLLVHPSGTDHTLWDPLLPALPPGRRLIRYDLRGHGSSPPGSGSYRHADDLLALLDALGLDRVDLIGASYGGQIAAEAVAAAPARVGALALLGPSLPDHDWSTEVIAAAGAQQAALAAGDEDEAVRLWMDTWVRGPSRAWADLDPALRAGLEPALRRSFALQSAGTATDLGADPALAAKLAAAGRPALVAVGEYDLADCGRIARRVAGLLDTEVTVVPGAGHLPGLERPAATGALLTRFLAAVA
ncbi:MAG TPA: alpha/beta hydrolase [Mycobacteriales bacterium]|nr:alpha/beta hydrolase [Mycobacteriales bacterium]